MRAIASRRPVRSLVNRLYNLAGVASGAVILLVIGNFLVQNIISQSQHDTDTTNLQADLAVQTLGTAMNDQETGLRGYIISAKSDFLTPLTDGRTTYEATIKQLRQIFGDASFKNSLPDLVVTEQRADDWYTQYALVQQDRVAKGQQAQAQQIEANGDGKNRFDRFRAALTNLQHSLDTDIANRTSVNDTFRVSVQIGAVALTLGLLIFLLLLFYSFIRDTRISLRRLTDATERLGDGDFAARLPEDGNDEFGLMSRNFNSMAVSLQRQTTTLRERDIQAAVLSISGSVNASLDLDTLLTTFLARLLDAFAVEVGTVYLVDAEHPQYLRLAASQGFDPTKLTPFIRVGEGDVGRAAQLHKPIITELASVADTDDVPRITTAFGSTLPRVLGHWPLALGDQVLGVLVLGSTRPLSATNRSTLDVVLPQVTTTISNAQAYTHINEQKVELERRGAELEVFNRQMAQQRDELRVINAALEESNRLRSQFLSTMSHELRTPLTAIIGFSQLSLRGAGGTVLPDKARANVERILKNGQNLLSLVNDVLDIAKIDAGRMDVAQSNVDVHAFIADLMAETQSLAVQKGLTFTASVDPAITTMQTDGDKLHQVVINLVSNALKYTEAGSVTVRVEPYRPSDGPRNNVVRIGAEMEQDRVQHTPYICFSVSDTGVGIPPDLQPKIFDEFYQVDGSTTRKVGGTGLGLSIVRKLVDLLGGRIELESSPGKGSTFTAIVPQTLLNAPSETRALPDDRFAAQTADASPPAISLPVVDGTQPVVLAIDDDMEMIRLIESTLEDSGFQVVGLTNPLQALEQVRQLHPRAITLDVLMPEANGWQVLQQLKSDPALATIPVIVLSIVSDRSAGYVLGADDYLVKPIDRERLIATLNRLTNQRVAVSVARAITGELPAITTAPPAHADSGYVLAIDDEPDIRQIIADTLESEGYTVRTAPDGPAGLALARDARPAAILLDLMMPGMDGFAVLEELRADPRTAAIPVIVLTAKTLTLPEREWLGINANRVVQKGNVPLERLADELRKYIAV